MSTGATAKSDEGSELAAIQADEEAAQLEELCWLWPTLPETVQGRLLAIAQEHAPPRFRRCKTVH